MNMNQSEDVVVGKRQVMKASAVLWCLAVVVIGGGTVHAQTATSPQTQLRGLGGVPVAVVEPYILPPRPELSLRALSRLAEATLKKHGVPILAPPRQSYLELVVSVPQRGGPRSHSVTLSLWELVSLSRDPQLKTLAVTWSRGVFEPVDEQDVVTLVTDAVRRVCEAFATDYNAVNVQKPTKGR